MKVSTTLTYDGLTQSSTTTLCKIITSNIDVVSTTYYPLNSDFTMESPSVVKNDFANLVRIYSDTSQPIYIVECGYASSTVCNSSEVSQARFFENVFSAWDIYYNNIKYITIFKTTDWSQQEVDDLERCYGISDTIFLEYLRTLGVRTWKNNGSNKLAYETILCELSARKWCSIGCDLTGLKNQQINSTIIIYPNPTNGLIHIETTKKIKSISLFNNIGKLNYSSVYKVLNLSNLNNGIYYLVIEFETGEIYRNKIVRQNNPF